MQPLLIVGAGGHGREVLDVVEAVNAADAVPRFTVVGVVADHADRELLDRRGARHLGLVADLVAHRLSGAPDDALVVVAVGDPRTRVALVEALDAVGRRAAPALVHPLASLGADVELGDGTVVAAGARVTTHVRCGRHVQVNVNAVVSHDVVLGDHVTLSPGCLVNGAATIGEGAFLGTGSIVTPGRAVGSWATVGAGAVVVRDVPPDVTAVGVPARWG